MAGSSSGPVPAGFPGVLPASAAAAFAVNWAVKRALRPLLVTDPGLIEAGWPDEMVRHLSAQGVRATVWNDLTPNPKDHEITAGHQVYSERGCDVIVAVGGGSVIDAAKGVAILAANGGSILDYEGVDRIPRPGPPLIGLCPQERPPEPAGRDCRRELHDGVEGQVLDSRDLV